MYKATDVLMPWLERMKMMFPAHWIPDNVDDDDLAKEGVNTYARQAIVLATWMEFEATDTCCRTCNIIHCLSYTMYIFRQDGKF